jgi:hypothetical protein
MATEIVAHAHQQSLNPIERGHRATEEIRFESDFAMVFTLQNGKVTAF